MLRTFIAVELDPAIQKELKSIQDHLKKSAADVTWVKPENIHVTLKFLGEISPEKAEIVKIVLKETLLGFQAFSFEMTHLGAFPKVENPRIIWAAIDAQEKNLSGMTKRLEQNLEQAGFKKDDQDFAPHITLGRLKTSTQKFALIKAIKAFNLTQPLIQEVTKVSLFKSTLTPQGPIYEALDCIDLKKAEPAV